MRREPAAVAALDPKAPAAEPTADEPKPNRRTKLVASE
jgi:hypothetical protein